MSKGFYGLFGLLLCLPVNAQRDSPKAEGALRKDLADGIGSRLTTSRIASLHDARRAAGEFANYIHNRTGHRLDREFVLRLAEAEWRAREAGRPTLSIERFSETATALFLKELGGPNAKLREGLGTTPYFVITPEKLNGARHFFRRNTLNVAKSDLPEAEGIELAPSKSSLPSVKKGYPIEAFLALYLCVTDDAGFPVARISERTARTGVPGISSNAKPFGDRGYFTRRPIGRLFSENNLSQILGASQQEGF